MKKIILTLMLGIFLLSLANASVPDLGVFKKDASIELKQTCVINGSFCDFCNISSVDYPNGTRAISDVAMTKRAGDFNYTLNESYTSPLGIYRVNGYCKYEADVMKNWVYYFEITYTGQDLEGSGVTAAIILIAVLALAFMFLYIGFKLSINPKLVPLSFFFIILALILGVYSLHLGWSLSHDIVQYESLSSTAGVIYISILWLLIGVTVISMALMLIAFIKELSNVVKTKQFGKDFNPVTNIYE